MVKIATEYAIHCGIDREVLTEVISIDDKGKGTIDYDKAKLTPFIPTTLFDILYEDYRYLLRMVIPHICLNYLRRSTMMAKRDCIVTLIYSALFNIMYY